MSDTGIFRYSGQESVLYFYAQAGQVYAASLVLQTPAGPVTVDLPDSAIAGWQLGAFPPDRLTQLVVAASGADLDQARQDLGMEQVAFSDFLDSIAAGALTLAGEAELPICESVRQRGVQRLQQQKSQTGQVGPGDGSTGTGQAQP